MNVKETNNLKEDSTTNSLQGTVSQKTQTSMELLLNGMKSLMSKLTNVNPNYKDTIDWKTLLTTIVENLHAVSNFKHETFDALQYATDFGTISKESLKLFQHVESEELVIGKPIMIRSGRQVNVWTRFDV